MAPGHQWPELDVARAAVDAGDSAKAVAILTRLAHNSPREPLLHFELGVLYSRLSDQVRAEQHLLQAIPLAVQSMTADPSSGAATILARCLAGAGQQSEASALFRASTGKGAAEYDLLMCYGQIFTQLGQRENAIAAYDAAAVKNPVVLTNIKAAAADWIKSIPFTADAPSPRYRHLIQQYELMHRSGSSDTLVQGAKTFEGFVGFSIVAPYVRRYGQELGARTLLDYGGGRGAQYDLGSISIVGETFADPRSYLGIDRVVCFDPGLGHDLPADDFDLVICVDALEHCDRQDLPWIIRQLFEKARLGVFANIASYPAGKTLPNGENAHCTIEEASWWAAVFAAMASEFPETAYRVIVSKDLRQRSRIVFGKPASPSPP